MTLARLLLESAGYTVLAATDAEAGLTMARAERPDLILMDIQLPGMDGLQATALLKGDDATRAIPVIALTALAMKGHEERIRAVGCDGYIAKPLHCKDFLATIAAQLGRPEAEKVPLNRVDAPGPVRKTTRAEDIMIKLARKVCVLGVGMTKFYKPGQKDYPELAKEAGEQALSDAGIDYAKIEQAFVGYVYGESTSGQRAVYQLGTTGIPVFNVNNNCSTGSTALMLGAQAIGAGVSECVLALGFEKMEKGSLGAKYTDRTLPLDKHFLLMMELQPFTPAPPAAQMFGGAAREHMEKYGTTREQLAKVASKNRGHAVHNERAQFREACTVEQILATPTIHDPLTKFQCCPTTDGAAAAVLCSEEFARSVGVANPVTLEAIALASDPATSFEPRSMIKMVGQDMARLAAQQVYERAGVGPEEVDVIELHDCFTSNELITYEALGLCGEGESGKLISDDATTYGGKWVVNPSGGLLSKGHPLGATGLAQTFELTEQLRGRCGARQVEKARVALQHNIGLGGACVVALYKGPQA